MDEVMEYLTPKEQDEYRALKTMFESDGWRVFQTKLEAAEQSQVLACAQAEDTKQLYRGQGRLIVLRELLAYETAIEQGVQAAAVERQLEQDADEGYE